MVVETVVTTTEEVVYDGELVGEIDGATDGTVVGSGIGEPGVYVGT